MVRLSLAMAWLLCSLAPSLAAEPFRIGLILPMSGPFAGSIGRQVDNGLRLYLQRNGHEVAGRKIEIIVRDDAGQADATRRHAQELVTSGRVDMLAGFGLTPTALAAAPVATRAQVPMIVMAAATSIITEQSPFVLRTSFTMAQNVTPLAEWAARNNLRRVVTLVSDYGPGQDAEKAFAKGLESAGGSVLGSLRAPLASPAFGPYLQRAKDLAPDAIFLFVPNGQGADLMKSVAERGFAEAGIKVIATGDVVDDLTLDDMGDPVLGMITSHHYSAAHPSPENAAYREAFMKAYGVRPNLMAIGGYDGMHLVFEALRATGGEGSGAALVEAMKGKAWMSPRGPISIDPQTRDIVQNVYIRKVERRDGALWNVEFETAPSVRDPGKTPSAAAAQ
ncbi:MAG: ABC transporter substrate-binding protein [Beijerinckiaceae bacterium]|nr:ABC transporter substrate-binding protein [Beijerinckiaceae bacterium]